MLLKSSEYTNFVEQLKKIEKQSFPNRKNSLIDLLFSKISENIFCFIDSKETKGYLLFSKVLDEGEILDVAVSPFFRKQKIAKNLLEETKLFSQNNQISSIYLEVREKNIPAILLYQKAGFKKIGTRKNYYSNPKENALIFKY